MCIHVFYHRLYWLFEDQIGNVGLGCGDIYGGEARVMYEQRRYLSIYSIDIFQVSQRFKETVTKRKAAVTGWEVLLADEETGQPAHLRSLIKLPLLIVKLGQIRLKNLLKAESFIKKKLGLLSCKRSLFLNLQLTVTSRQSLVTSLLLRCKNQTSF